MPEKPTCWHSPLWVVSTYYNPSKYRRRYKNFHVFRRFLNAPLLVVELERHGDFQLTKDDADIVVQLKGEDRIWQKERLLNIGIEKLPDHVEFVAWVDCDVLFQKKHWAELAIEALQNGACYTQLFGTLWHMPSSWEALKTNRHRNPADVAIQSELGFIHWLAQEPYSEERYRYTRDDVYSNGPQSNGDAVAIAPGIGWASRRETISQTTLYDVNIVGSGDVSLAFAAAGLSAKYETALIDVRVGDALRPWLTPAQREHYRRWASCFASLVDGNITYLPQDVYHLWHGDLANRNYDQRFRPLIEHGFDPDRDLTLSTNATWQWKAPKSQLAQDVAAYFDARKEDG